MPTSKLLGEQALSQVSDAQLHWQPTAESNSLVIIVKHHHEHFTDEKLGR